MADDLSVLVLCGRFPPATAIVRAFHDAGARVDVADSLEMAPALHSNRADKTHLVAAPAREPERFAHDVAAVVADRGIDLVLPSFEDTFFIARYADLVPAPIFAPPFPVLAGLHDKSRFVELCGRLGLRTRPRSSPRIPPSWPTLCSSSPTSSRAPPSRAGWSTSPTTGPGPARAGWRTARPSATTPGSRDTSASTTAGPTTTW